ncbi:MAG: PEP-CTERM sorting domain-containing protein [Phycisphaerae bacterium]|nr:PEP-CTERM sorting domain-containing protein [Phycisphaerae bacterium]
MFKAASVLILLLLVTSFAYAHSHTHVGRNPDGTWGNGDDNQLWIFATPDQPQWGTVEMIPTGEYIGDKQIYASVLDCWHSAHPETGLFQLDFNGELTQPDWRIGLKRIGFSDTVNFWMEDEATTLEILTYDGATIAFEEPDWDTTLPDGAGGFGAWHFHNHTEFLALAAAPGQTFSATFTVFDTGSTAFPESAQYTLDFVTVPEPASVVLLTMGLFAFVRQKKSMR